MRRLKILQFGPGNAREHATHRALMGAETEVLTLIKNANALLESEAGVRRVRDLREAMRIAQDWNPDGVIVGSPNELIAGDADAFRAAGFRTFGVSREAAQFESSKEMTKTFLRRHGLPTPDYFVANTLEEAEHLLKTCWRRTRHGYVIKTERFSMNAYDRTVTPDTLEEALDEARRLSPSGKRARLILEERIKGYELSVHLFVDHDRYALMPPVQDYKRLLVDHQGAMTHGVASVAQSLPFPSVIEDELKRRVIEPTLEGFLKDGVSYQSMIYIGVMMTQDGPQILEYNIRSGNPEWLALTGLLARPLGFAFDAFWNGEIEKTKEFWREGTVSLAAYALTQGYPTVARTVFPETVEGIESLPPDIVAFGDSIARRNGVLHPTGGRVLALGLAGHDFGSTRARLVSAFNNLHMDGLYFRPDLSPLPF